MRYPPKPIGFGGFLLYNEINKQKGEIKMSEIKNIIKGLAESGKVRHEVTIQDTKFVLRTISSEEQFLVESMTSIARLKEKYKTEEISSYMDTLSRMRNVSLLAYVVESINGIATVEEGLNSEEDFKARMELRDSLSALSPLFIDRLIKGHNEVMDKNRELFKDLKENLGK